MYQNGHQEALQLLDVAELGPFAAQYSEAEGDAQYALGNVEAARAAYEEALLAPGAEWVNRTFIEMKLDSLEVTPAEETGT
jgi:predicted negative regulator of RcsB-dependent stress response